MPNTGVIAACPFYITHSSGRQWQYTITCEDIRNMGFSMRNQLRFLDHEEQESYLDLFCADEYGECPYYQAIYSKYVGQGVKEPQQVHIDIPRQTDCKPKRKKKVLPAQGYQQISLFEFIENTPDRQ